MTSDQAQKLLQSFEKQTRTVSLHGKIAGESRRKITCSGAAVHAQGCRVPELHMNMTTGLQRLPHICLVTFAQERSVTFAANVTALKLSCFQAFTPSRHRAWRCQRQGFEFRRGALWSHVSAGDNVVKNGRRVVLLDFGVAQQSQDCVELAKAGLLLSKDV